MPNKERDPAEGIALVVSRMELRLERQLRGETRMREDDCSQDGGIDAKALVAVHSVRRQVRRARTNHRYCILISAMVRSTPSPTKDRLAHASYHWISGLIVIYA